MAKCTFVADEQAHQLAYFEHNFADRTGHRGRAFQLLPAHRLDGILPGIRETAERLFGELRIQWHPYIGHGRSSQACCVNFLLPLASRPALLSRWVSRVLGETPMEMLQVEKPSAGEHRYVAFEYTGPGDKDCLDEAGGRVPTRGAHATAADAAFAFIDEAGKRRLVLVEWKYTEEYRSHRLSPDSSGKRQQRYGDKLVTPRGPIREDLDLALAHFLHEPFYQLARQQMLAWQIEQAPDSGFDQVSVLHLSPSGNKALHAMSAPNIAGALNRVDGKCHDDAFEAYRACLVDPSSFMSRTIEFAFGGLAEEPEAYEWYDSIATRYPSLCASPLAE